MRRQIPAPLIAALSDVLPDAYTHGDIDRLLMHAGAPGDPPQLNKQMKVQEWLRRVNRDESVDPVEVLGRVLEPFMEADPDAPGFQGEKNRDRLELLSRALARAELQYVKGGIIAGSLGQPSRSLDDLIRGRNMAALDEEFGRALKSVEGQPKDAVSAACNILESACKLYIADRAIEPPQKQDIQGLWNVVRKDLGFDPSLVEDNDLKQILSGLIAIVGGIGALRTHASSAHGRGVKVYRLEPRHARLAVHSAHTLVAFLIESWDKRVKGAASS